MAADADQLLATLQAATAWPPTDVAAAWANKARWVAHREADRTALAQLADVDPDTLRYRVDPLPQRISDAYAALTFGRTPRVTPASPADEDASQTLVTESNLGAELQRAEAVRCSEGEVWWRIVLDRAASPRPTVVWHSRLGVIPLFVGRRLAACAFISRYDLNDIVYRHLEVHDGANIENVLFAGATDRLGDRVPLDTIPPTDRLVDQIAHDLSAMPAGWVPNRLGTISTEGVSDYAGIEDYLFDLNEALQTAHNNANLTARARMIVPQAALDENGRLRDDNIIVAEQVDAALSDTSGGVGNAYRVLEYSFDAAAMIAYQDSLARGALTRVGLVPQFVGVATEDGQALSGTALRVRLIPSVNAAEAKASYWDSELPKLLALLQTVDAKPWDGEPGVGWADPATPPKVDRGATLPTDPQEEADRIALLRNAKVMSVEETVAELHPSWPVDQRSAEVERLNEESAPPPIFAPVANS